MNKALIIDTCIMCCWLEVPGKETAGSNNDVWNHERVERIFEDEERSGTTLVLPLATIVETGNHISQAPSRRYECANALGACLVKAADKISPWAAFKDQTTLWQPEHLRELARDWPELAASRLSIGDATIREVANHYGKAGMSVEILTADKQLRAYSPTPPAYLPRRRR